MTAPGARMAEPKAPALDPATVAPRLSSNYPPAFTSIVAGREKRALGDALGLTNFGVNLTTLPPGAASSARHWHSRQDEFLYILEGEAVLVTDAGEQVLTPGMAAGFPAGRPDGHQLVNRSDRPVVYLEVGDRTAGDELDYPDIDMLARQIDGEQRFVRKTGERY